MFGCKAIRVGFPAFTAAEKLATSRFDRDIFTWGRSVFMANEIPAINPAPPTGTMTRSDIRHLFQNLKAERALAAMMAGHRSRRYKQAVLHRTTGCAAAWLATVARTRTWLIDGYDDPAIIAGQGTLGLEILEQVPDVDLVIVPVGGAGLIAGFR